MAALEIIGGSQASKRFRLLGPTYVGRAPDGGQRLPNFISLPGDAVSRLHARILRQGSGYFVEDLGSTNGTELHGKRIQPRIPYLLNDGDEIRIGAAVLRFRAEEADPAQPAPVPLHRPPPRVQGAVLPPVTLVSQERESPTITTVLSASQATNANLLAEASAKRNLAEALRRLQAMVRISLALGATTDQDTLLQRITDEILAMFPSADRVLVVLREEGKQVVRPVAVKQRSAPGAVMESVAVRRAIITEVLERSHAILWQDNAEAGNRRGDADLAAVHPAVRSAMSAPLLAGSEVLGLIQVDTAASTTAFGEEELHMLTGICAQIAIALRNAQHYADVERLFEGFIRASVQAIESRDPVTAGHSFRVAELAGRLATAVVQAELHGPDGARFTAEQLRELRYAALLHDFGKIGVREHILTKAKKLYPHQIALVRERFHTARALLERQTYRDLIEMQLRSPMEPDEFSGLWSQIADDLAQETAQLEQMLEAVERANEPGALWADLLEQLQATAQYGGGEGEGSVPLLQEAELECLQLAAGNLSAEEREQLQSHVVHTFAFLSLIPWTKSIAQVPAIAYAHHERLDGSGYPRSLTAAQLPLQARILAIADVFDALRAGDRPYRSAMPEHRVLEILREEARAGRLDETLVDLFIRSAAYRLDDHDWR